jgi:Mycothiol maleylpyruvate isomerase N-terminal domain
MTTHLAVRDEAMRAFISAVTSVEATAPTWCQGWSAHYLAAHVAAAAEERASLIEDYLAGRPSRATRPWEVREPPFRAMPTAVLRQELAEQAERFESAVAALGSGQTIAYTGWAMSAERLRMHSHSEAVLHRWDLVGDDDISVRLLSDPALVTHAVAVFDAIPALAEAQRWQDRGSPDGPIILRASGQPGVALTPGSGLSMTTPSGGTVIELLPHELPLLLWGRCPARLKNPAVNGESAEEVLRRLVRRPSSAQ